MIPPPHALGYDACIMHVSLLTITLRLPGCASLKEKRRRVRGVMSKLSTSATLAVCESGHQNDLQTAEWSFVCGALTAALVEQSFDLVERSILERVDGEIVRVERSRL